MTTTPPIIVTRADYERLNSLLDGVSGANRDAADNLEMELGRAEVVDAAQIPADVVRMNSRVVYRDENAKKTVEVQLCYPADAQPEQGRISVLAPIGAALLGLRVGQEIEWPMPNGVVKRLTVQAVHQPESGVQASTTP